MARRTLTDIGVKKLRPRASRYFEPDPEMPGHYVRVHPSGGKSFVATARDPRGKQVWVTIGAIALFTIEAAREKARTAIKAIKAGDDTAEPQSFEAVSADWFKRHVEAKGLRSGDESRRYLNKHILPAWGGREFTTIRRGDVAKLLDDIEDGAGPVAADFALAVVRNIANWFATRHDNYVNPVVKGMRRSNPKERARERILDDDELRAVWKRAEANGAFGAFVRLALLTAQRREKIAAMRWEDVSVDGTWNIPAEAREKGNAGALVLPPVAVEIIRSRPRFGENSYVLAGRGDSYFQGYSKMKAAFDAKVSIAPWTIHDLRRTSRSLMSRAGVRPDIAERVMGHAIKGVEGTYDRHQYRDEKASALRSLAGLIETILNPPVGNVVPMTSAR